jgi:hypothetical protein
MNQSKRAGKKGGAFALWNRGHLGDCIITLNYLRRCCRRDPQAVPILYCRSSQYFHELELLADEYAPRIAFRAWPDLHQGPRGAVDAWLGAEDFLFRHHSDGDYPLIYRDLFEKVSGELGIQNPIETPRDNLFEIPRPPSVRPEFDWLVLNAVPYSRQWAYNEADFDYLVSRLLAQGDRIVTTHRLRHFPHVPSTWDVRLPLRRLADLACSCKRIIGINTAPMHVVINTSSFATLSDVYSMDNRHYFAYDDRFHKCFSIYELISLLLRHGHLRPAEQPRFAAGAPSARVNGVQDAPMHQIRSSRDRIFWCHIDDPCNLGDQVACPIDYADLPGERIDLTRPVGSLEASAIIFGGGGLLHGDRLTAKIGRMAQEGRRQNPKLRLIAWGLGANQHGRQTAQYPDFLRTFDLVGIRDRGNPWHYVPCPSCLHPAFDHPPGAPTREFIVYEHFQVPMVGLPRAPLRTNDADRREFPDVITFLAQGECIITNSFHGAYWGLLLGRKVVIFRPFSNRFLGFARHVEYCDETDWQQKMRRSARYPDYLDECRTFNRQFLFRVRTLLEDISEYA